MTVFKKVLEDVTTRLGESLPAQGFPPACVLSDDRVFRRRWRRGNGWKEDVIEIVYRRGGESSLHVNLQVRLPELDFDVDGTGLRTPYLTGLLASFRTTALATKTVEIVLANLNWFHGLADPKQCVERLLARPMPGAPKAAAAVRYLESLHV